jgi:ABC-type molybdate transport system permease subunit
MHQIVHGFQFSRLYSVSSQGFVITLMLVLATDLVLGTFLQRHPHPLLVLICLPFFPVVCGGILLLILCREASKLDSQVG